jgi:hypothetical protein
MIGNNYGSITDPKPAIMDANPIPTLQNQVAPTAKQPDHSSPLTIMLFGYVS